MSIDKEVRVIISTIDKYSTGAVKAVDSFDSIGKSLFALNTMIITTGAALATFSIKIGSDLVKSAADFHDGMIDVFSITETFGTTQEDIIGIQERLVNMFPVTGKAASDALTMIAQTGFGTKEELEAVAKAALTLKIATGSDLMTGVEALTAIMNSFNLSVGETERIMNLLTASYKTTAADVSSIREAFKYAGPTAATLGLSIEETVAALAVFKDIGLEASQTGSNLRGGMTNLARETTGAKKALAELGLTFDDVSPETHSITELVDIFSDKTLTLNQSFKLFGKTNLAFGTLLTTQSQKFKDILKAVTGTNAAITSLEQRSKKYSVVMENLEGSMDIFKKTIAEDMVPAIINMVGIDERSGIRGAITNLYELEKATGDIGEPMATAFNELKINAKEAFAEIGGSEGLYDGLADLSEIGATIVQIFSEFAIQIVKAFSGNSATNITAIQVALHGLRIALTSVGAVITGAHDLFVGFVYAMELGLATVKVAYKNFILVLYEAELALTKVSDKLPFLDQKKHIGETEEKIKDLKAEINTLYDIDPPDLWTPELLDGTTNAAIAVENYGKKSKEAFGDSTAAALETVDAINEVVGIPLEPIEVEVGVNQTSLDKAKADATSFVTVFGPQESIRMIEVGVSEESIVDTKKSFEDLKKELPTDKLIQIEVDLQLAKIKQQSEIVQTSIEWKAKLDIAEVEANTKKIEVMFESINTSINSTGDMLGDLFGKLGGEFQNAADRWKVSDQIDKENLLREKSFELQKKMIEAEMKYMKAKQDAMDKGDFSIKVQADGLKPHLEAFMWEILSEVQIRANSEQSEFLLGI